MAVRLEPLFPGIPLDVQRPEVEFDARLGKPLDDNLADLIRGHPVAFRPLLQFA